MGRPAGKTPLGRPRCRWEDNVQRDLQEVGWGDMDWIDLSQGRDRWLVLVNAVMNLGVEQNAVNFLTSREQVSFLWKNSAPWS